MSITLAVLRARVSSEINDADAKHGTFDGPQLDQKIANAYLALQSWLPPPHLYITSAFTIAAAGDTFTLPVAANANYVSGTQYAGDIRIRLTNRPMYGNLHRSTVEEIDALRNLPSPSLSWPQRYCLWEQNEQTVQGRCWPPASVAEPCDLFVSLVADDLRDAADMDAANVRFSRYGATALVYRAAALCVAAMDEESLKLRRLSPGVAREWLAMSERIAYKEAARRHNESGVGRIMRNVS